MIVLFTLIFLLSPCYETVQTLSGEIVVEVACEAVTQVTGNDADTPIEPIPPPLVLPVKNTPWLGEILSSDTGYCGTDRSGYGWGGYLSSPLPNGTIHRVFEHGHSGIDIDAPVGTAIVAAAPGRVVWAGFSKWGGGNLVVLAHGGAWETYYAHMLSVSVSCGQFVTMGQQVGTLGQTGMASWPHLHFELRRGFSSYNPSGFWSGQ